MMPVGILALVFGYAVVYSGAMGITRNAQVGVIESLKPGFVPPPPQASSATTTGGLPSILVPPTSPGGVWHDVTGSPLNPLNARKYLDAIGALITGKPPAGSKNGQAQ